MMVSSVFLILTTSPSLAWIVAISLPFLAVVVWYVAVKTRPLSEKQQATLDKINQYARENLTDFVSSELSLEKIFKRRSSLLKMLSMRIIQANFSN